MPSLKWHDKDSELPGQVGGSAPSISVSCALALLDLQVPGEAGVLYSLTAVEGLHSQYGMPSQPGNKTEFYNPPKQQILISDLHLLS